MPTRHPGPPSAPLRRRILLGALCALTAGAVYGVALTNPFIYDDYRLILENRSIHDLSDWRGLVWHDVSRPLVNVSYAIDYAIWGGPNPFGFHLTNLLIHVANVALLFIVAIALAQDGRAMNRARSGRIEASVFTALLFAVHPLLTQAVGYVAGRSELFCTFFMLLSLLAARRAMWTGRRIWWVPAFAAWGLALASREVAAMFPFALLIYDRICQPGDPARRSRRLLLVHAPLIALAVFAGLTRIFVLTQIEYAGSRSPIVWRFGLVELDVFRRYLQLIVWPRGQTIFHAIPPIRGLFELRAIAGIVVAALFVAVIQRLRRVDAAAAVGMSWFALMLIPTAVLVMLDRGEPMAEHRVYTASAGFFIALGGLAAVLLYSLERDRSRLWLAEAAATVVIILLGAQTVMRNLVWHRPVSLWLEAAERAPDHWLPRMGLGEALHQEGRHEDAIAMFRAAVALRPVEALAYAKLGQCQMETRRWADAAGTFETLRGLDPSSPAAQAGLAVTALQVGDTAVARRYLQELIDRDPESVPWRQAMAMIAEPADPAEALRVCEEIERLAPQTPGNDECIQRNRDRLAALSSH